MILSTSLSDPPAPRLLSALPSTMGDMGSMSRNPLEEAEQMCASFMGDYATPTSPVAFDLIHDFRIDCPEKELWKLLPTPPRSPDRSDYSSLVNGSIDASAVMTPCAFPSGGGGSISQAWVGFDEWGPFGGSAPGEVPPADDQEALCAILFEHDDLIEQLLRDDAVFNSVLDGAAEAGIDGDELPVEDWSSPSSPTQPAVKSELLHDCMWSGQCTDDCKQKAAREKRAALAATPTSSLDAVAPASAMTSADEDAVVPLLRGAAAVSRIIDDESAATQCVDPSSVLGYTPLSDHSYHQAQSSAPPTPPDSPRVTPQQNSTPAPSATTVGSSGSTSSQPILLVRSRNGVWKREIIVSDTPSESDDDDDDDDEEEEEEEEEREKQNDGDDDDSDDDDDDDEEDEEIDVVTVAGERHHAGRQGMPAVVALPTHGAVGTVRSSHVAAGRSRNVISAPASPVVVASRMTSSGRVVTPSQKLLSTGPTSRRRHGPRGGAAHHSAVSGGKRRRSRHAGHHTSTPQAKRSRRDDDDDDDSSSSTTPSTNGRRGHHHHLSLSQLPPSAKRNEHNTMERKRRDDLRVAFQQLRVQVPALADNKKAAKVTILSEAASYVTKLIHETSQIEKAFWQETQRRDILKQRLAQLQRSGAARGHYQRYRR